MAEDNKPKRRVVKKTTTVRQQRADSAEAKPKQRRVRKTINKANRPMTALRKKLLKFISPLRFLLRPFKSKPARFIGRILYKILGIGYFVGSWKELRLVQWPKRGETAKLTIAVFVFAFAIASFIALLDYGLDKIFRQLLT